jgi:GxxExxY protein
MEHINQLCSLVRETAYAIHLYHGHGHLEKVYENALAHRLRKAGLRVHQQHPIPVSDEDGTIIGEYFADLIIEEVLIADLKACRALIDEHTAQVLGYLRGAGKEHGILINFGLYKLQIETYAMSSSPCRTYVSFFFLLRSLRSFAPSFVCVVEYPGGRGTLGRRFAGIWSARLMPR